MVKNIKSIALSLMSLEISQRFSGMPMERALNNAARGPDTEERAEAKRGTPIRFAWKMVTEWAAKARGADKRLDKVSLACACGRVRSP